MLPTIKFARKNICYVFYVVSNQIILIQNMCLEKNSKHKLIKQLSSNFVWFCPEGRLQTYMINKMNGTPALYISLIKIYSTGLGKYR